MPDKETILCEIRRLAEQSGGRSPGEATFTKATGIGQHEWKGVFWRRWSEAQAEAGFTPNKFGGRTEDAVVLDHYLALVMRLGAVPVDADLRLARRQDPSFPSTDVFRRLGSKKALIRRAIAGCEGRGDLAPVRDLLLAELGRPTPTQAARVSQKVAGYVYLIRSGKFHKIGRTNASGRQLRELAIQLPQKPRTVQVIETDDPEGIEGYWHRRFAARRQDGEWFLLS
jgi:hypothetical protein